MPWFLCFILAAHVAEIGLVQNSKLRLRLKNIETGRLQIVTGMEELG
jgi:hypothetical protein